MKKKYITALLLTVLALMLTGCSVENIPSFQAMLFGEPEFVKLSYKPSDYVTLGQYKDIEVDGSVSESDISDYIDQLIETGDEKDIRSDEKVVKNGQLINFDYSGKLKNGKKFEGGTADSQFLRVGSGKMIDGFEEALEGMKVGEKKKAEMKFPDNYSSTDLAGKDVIFTLKVNYICKEADDALVKKLDSTYNTKTVQEYKDAVKKELETQNEQEKLSTAMSKVSQNAKIENVPKELVENIKKTNSKQLSSQAEMYGVDVDTLLSAYGMTEESYYESIAKERILIEAVAEEENYRITKQDYEDKMAEILKQVDMTEKEYRNNFKEATGEGASLEDYVVYMMKYDFFYELVESTMKSK